MKRRDFCKLIVGAGIIVPSVAFGNSFTEISIPTTADELYLAVNKLFKSHATISKKRLEEAYRGIHKHATYALGSTNKVNPEEHLVKYLWKMFTAQKRNGITDIWWRELPSFGRDNDFPSIGEPIKYRLYTRCSLYPNPVPTIWHKPEGGDCRYLDFCFVTTC